MSPRLTTQSLAVRLIGKEDGMKAYDWRNKDGQLVYDPKANKGKGGYTKHATQEEKKFGEALRKTETGKKQFDKLVNSEVQVKVLFDPGRHKDKDGKTTNVFGKTDNGEVQITTDTKGKAVDAKVLEGSTITIYKGMIEKAVADNNDPNVPTVPTLYDKSIEGLSYFEIGGAVFGHEIEHTTKENILDIANEGKGAAEKGPTKVSDKIVDEINAKKKRKN
jgi:hypothetical protein